MGVPDFSRIEWIDDVSFTIGEWTFREHPDDGSGVPLETTDWFWFYKPRRMVDEYAKVFETRPGFVVDRALELGIWAGGSVPFWYLIAQPERFSALDIDDRGDPALLRRFRDAHSGIATHWSCSQSDRQALDQIIEHDDLAPLDLIIDDASHLYGLSRDSFQLLFGRLRPGGLYCLEDWQWSFAPQSQSGDSPLSTQRPLVDLVYGIVAMMGSQRGLISRIDVHPDFVIVERGDATLDSPFEIESLIRRRDRPSFRRRTAQVRSKVRREAAGMLDRARSRRGS